MRRVLPIQWVSPFPPGHYGLSSAGRRSTAQPGQATPAGSLPAEPGGDPRGLGYRLQSSRRSGASPISDAGPRDPAPLSRPAAANPLRGAARAVKLIVLSFIRFYQACLSPVLPSSCRYYPTCSAYAYEAVERWGVWRGGGLSLRRLLRCRPFGGRGYDPVP